MTCEVHIPSFSYFSTGEMQNFVENDQSFVSHTCKMFNVSTEFFFECKFILRSIHGSVQILVLINTISQLSITYTTFFSLITISLLFNLIYLPA